MDSLSETGYAIIGAMAPRPGAAGTVGPLTRLRADLAYDSLRLLELAMALERQFGLPEAELDDALDVTTAGDVVEFVRRVVADGGSA